jgi:carboxyl-terminal processing protease
MQHREPRTNARLSRFGRFAIGLGAVAALTVASTVRSEALLPAPPPSQSPSTTDATTNPSPAPTTTKPAVTPVEYTTIALDFIERYSLRKTTVDMVGLRARALERAQRAASIADTYPIIRAALKELGDKHSSFSPPVDATALLEGKYNGFGFTATWPGRLVIAMATDGPAAKAGMKLNDRIDKIDGKAPTGGNGTLSIARVNGKLPDKIKVTVTRPKVRKPIVLTIAIGQPTLVSAPKAAVVPGKVLADRVGYLDLQGVVTDPAGQVAWASSVHEAIRTVDATERCGWVLDLRKNRGGYIYPMIASVGPLLGTGVVSGKRDADGKVETWNLLDAKMRVNERLEVELPNPYRLRADNVPVALLISPLTASAAEAITVSFIGRPNTRSFGGSTLGLTTFNVMRALPDSALIAVTNAAFIDRNGQAYDGPIAPDQPVEFDWATVGTENDAALNAAVTWLSSQPRCVA